jgi:hypothetical protein
LPVAHISLPLPPGQFLPLSALCDCAPGVTVAQAWWKNMVILPLNPVEPKPWWATKKSALKGMSAL